VITGAGPSWIERRFRIALLVKGIDGAAELIGAVILLVFSGVMVIREYVVLRRERLSAGR
jgi:uncharacterized membrane protein